MPSRSEADRILREHRELQDATDALQKTHESLESTPYDADAHRAHKREIGTHLTRLREHAAKQRALRRK
jgi:hypothetical protein